MYSCISYGFSLPVQVSILPSTSWGNSRSIFIGFLNENGYQGGCSINRNSMKENKINRSLVDHIILRIYCFLHLGKLLSINKLSELWACDQHTNNCLGTTVYNLDDILVNDAKIYFFYNKVIRKKLMKECAWRWREGVLGDCFM